MAMKNFGIVIKGISSGATSYKNKDGVLFHQLLVVVPGSAGVLKVGLDSAPIGDQYPVGQNIELSCIPRFYNGNVSGFDLV